MLPSQVSLSGKAQVRERLRDERKRAPRQAQDQRRSVPVLDVGGLGSRTRARPPVSTTTCRLRPLTFLPASLGSSPRAGFAPRTPALGRLDALAVDHGGADASRPTRSRSAMTRRWLV